MKHHLYVPSLTLLALVAAGCGPSEDTAGKASGDWKKPGMLRVVNLGSNPCSIKIDAQVMNPGLAPATGSAYLPLKEGTHKVLVKDGNTELFSGDVELKSDDVKSLVVTGSKAATPAFLAGETRKKPDAGNTIDVYFMAPSGSVTVSGGGGSVTVNGGEQKLLTAGSDATDLAVKNGTVSIPVTGTVKPNMAYSLIVQANKANLVQNSGNAPTISGAPAGA